jgi:hypothetical protein
MATLITRVSDLATRTATQDKILKTLINGNAADLSSLATTDKSHLVAALNELKGRIDAAVAASGAVIDDTTSSTTKTYSSSKINAAISTAVSNLVNGAGTALDTLKELADALNNDPNFATTIMNGLANRVRFDAAQTLTAAQKAQAKANIDAYGNAEIGDPDTNFVSVFNAGLV